MKLAIIGSRGFTDLTKAKEAFRTFCCTWQKSPHENALFPDVSRFNEIVSGGARGADKIGADIAREWNIKLTEFLPDWEKYGKRAGFIRNEDIIKAADVVLAFWDGQSKGTGNSLSHAKRLKKTTIIVYF